MNKHIKLAVAVGGAVLATAAGVAGSAPTAAAQQPAQQNNGAVVVRTPAHPGVTTSATGVQPTVSPGVAVTYVKPSTGYTCSRGYLCETVWDAPKGEYAVFHMYTCRTYSLSNWLGTGNYYDNQTGGVRSYFYGASGNTLKSFTSGYNVNQNWTPVYKIKSC